MTNLVQCGSSANKSRVFGDTTWWSVKAVHLKNHLRFEIEQ